MIFNAELALKFEAILGEGPIWSAAESALYFVDIKKPGLYRYKPGTGINARWNMPEEIGCFALREKGGFIAAMRSGIYLLDAEGKVISTVAPNPDDPDKSRFNDGCVDPWGRFWCGTLWEENDYDLRAKIIRVDENLKTEVMAEGLNIANGLAFSPDRKWVYYSDTSNNIIYRQGLDPVSGQPKGPREEFRHLGDGQPDGAAIDTEGNYWSALFDGSAVECLGSKGQTLHKIEIPVPRPTMAAFGGPRLQTLFITTASDGLSSKDLERFPDSGSIFKLELPFTGLPIPNFLG